MERHFRVISLTGCYSLMLSCLSAINIQQHSYKQVDINVTVLEIYLGLFKEI